MTADRQTENVVSMLHRSARQYATNGVHIFPCQPRGKQPATHRGFKDATTDLNVIDTWWTDNPNYNIGIACGKTGIFVVDVDGPTAAAALEQLTDRHGPLPDTYSITTGRQDGGTHLTFWQPAGQPIGNRKLGAAGKLETRGAGGYVIAPPSVHPTGAHYQPNGKWDNIARPPQWLVQLATDPTPAETLQLPTKPTNDAQANALSIAGRVALGTEGNRNHLLYWGACKIGGLIAAGRLDQTYGQQLLEGAAQRAGLPDREAQATIDSGLQTGYQEPDHGPQHGSWAHIPDPTVINHETDNPTDDTYAEVDRLYPPLDFAKLWDQGIDDVDWIVPGILEAGRSYSFYAPAKTGKSLIMLEMAICVANGIPFAGIPVDRARPVLYIDMEMTPGDVIARIKDMGFGPEHLENLHYLSLPALPPLDVEEGGQHIATIAARWQADLVIFDTASRVVEGPENDADTWRAFYNHTGQRLKAAGHCAARLDHAGKNASRGQRGSSAKNDDVDGVFKISRKGDWLQIEPEQQRTANVLSEPLVMARDHNDGRLHQVYKSVTLTDEQQQLCDQIDALGVPDRAGHRETVRRLKAADISFDKNLLTDVIHSRKGRPETTILEP